VILLVKRWDLVVGQRDQLTGWWWVFGAFGRGDDRE
jgi:hypothetical protein